MNEPLKGISVEKELSGLALVVTLPQLISSPISVAIASLLHTHSNISFEVKEIIDFLVISFPLTLAIAVIVILINESKITLFSVVLTLIIATLLSNLLHKVVANFPGVDLNEAWHNTFSYTDPHNTTGNPVVNFILAVLGLYWKKFGAILFIQSCIIGIYAGLRFISITEKKKSPPANQENKIKNQA
ncbi:MAG: hypothetical protein ACHQEB_03105 [Chitinophagales bacterium]